MCSLKSWYTKDATLDDIFQRNGYDYTIKDTICTKNNKNIESTNVTNFLPVSLYHLLFIGLLGIILKRRYRKQYLI